MSVRAQYSNLFSTNSNSRCHGSLRRLNGRTRDRPPSLSLLYFLLLAFKFKLLWPAVSQPVRLGVGPSSEAHDQIFITVGHLRCSGCGAPSLTRGRVCNVQFAVTLGFKSLEFTITCYCFIWDSLNLEGQVPEQDDPVISPGTRFPFFVASYDSQDYGGGILTPLQTGMTTGQSQSYITTDNQLAAISHGVRLPSGTRDQFFSFIWLVLNSYGFVDVEHPLWRKVRSVVFSCCWASPAQSFSVLVPWGSVALSSCHLYIYIERESWSGSERHYIWDGVEKTIPSV
jgi:hypothetical protein